MQGLTRGQRVTAQATRLSPPISSASAPAVPTQLDSVRSCQPAPTLITTLITENMPNDRLMSSEMCFSSNDVEEQ